MTFLEALKAHRGGLVRIKTQLYWYSGRGWGWDGITGRVCLLLDAAPAMSTTAAARTAAVERAATAAEAVGSAALLLIDGHPQWVWVGADDLELLSSFEPEEQ